MHPTRTGLAGDHSQLSSCLLSSREKHLENTRYKDDEQRPSSHRQRWQLQVPWLGGCAVLGTRDPLLILLKLLRRASTSKETQSQTGAALPTIVLLGCVPKSRSSPPLLPPRLLLSELGAPWPMLPYMRVHIAEITVHM